MKIPVKYRKHAFSAAVVVVLAASLSAFMAAYQQDKVLVRETAALALRHFLYALDMQDDMGVIDWAKSLEKRDRVLAFQATVDGKVVAEGGNRNYLPSSPREGVRYVFPDTWRYYCRETRETRPSGGTVEMALVYRHRPGPFFPALIVVFACLFTAVLIWWAQMGNAGVSHPAPASLQADKNRHCASPLPFPLENELADPHLALLFLDKQFIIRRVSPRAAKLMGLAPEHLVNSHLLDLSPGPRLMKAIEKSTPASLPDAFPSHPGLCVSLKPEAHGIFLYLEPKNPTSGA